MTILISLFFISLISIAIMFEKKLALLKNQSESITEKGTPTLEMPYVVEIKDITIRKVKRAGYLGLITIIRLYFRSLNFLKYKYDKLKDLTKNIHKNTTNDIEKKEINRFLKVVSDYKNKIRKIKSRIKEEEKRL